MSYRTQGFYSETGDDWKPIRGIASVAVDAPEPLTEWDRMGQKLLEPLRPAVVALSATFQILETRFDNITKAIDIATQPRPQRNNAMHRYGRRLSPMRTAYRAKTKHRRRNR